MESQGLPRGVVAYDFADPQSGEQQAVFDLAWPNGIAGGTEPAGRGAAQRGRGNDHARQPGGIPLLHRRCESFQRYVTAEVLAEATHA